jgi:predicted membrane-bound spermidine synthase
MFIKIVSTKNKVLLLTILIEGYVVLSIELLAIRQLSSFVGSGTDTISIIIATVLMSLAFGYFAGGNFRSETSNSDHQQIRNKLTSNFTIAFFILLFGLSFSGMTYFFENLYALHIENRLILTLTYACVFLSYPIFLLGQTIPLVSNLLPTDRISKLTGQILFYSTLGSCIGSIVTTLVLMETIGVHHTANVALVMLALLAMAFTNKKSLIRILALLTGVIIMLSMNSTSNLRESFNIVSNNQYNVASTYEDNGWNRLILNGAHASGYHSSGEKYPYAMFLEKQLLHSIPTDAPPKNILVLGAGGFTFGSDDKKNNYIYVDIDPSLKKIAEKYLFKKKLLPNKRFVPLDARSFLIDSREDFDIIMIDAYSSALQMPTHLMTHEFFQLVRSHLTQNGVMALNFLGTQNFTTQLSRNFDDTLRSVFPFLIRHSMSGSYNLFSTETVLDNIIYIYKHDVVAQTKTIYTDNLNGSIIDQMEITNRR